MSFTKIKRYFYENLRRVSSIITGFIILSSSILSNALGTNYTVLEGDSYWKISQKFSINLDTLLIYNNADKSSILREGQIVVIPPKKIHTVNYGETYWTISKLYETPFNVLLNANNANTNSQLSVGQKIIIPAQEILSIKPTMTPIPTPKPTPTPTPTAMTKPLISPTPSNSTSNYITYKNYIIQKYDTLWSISIKFGLPVNEILKQNNLTEASVISIGQILTIPVHHIAIKNTLGDKFGEYLDWWTEAQYVVPTESIFEVEDFYTGKSFMAKRTTGAYHADCEPLTLSDTYKMKEIWGGNFSWLERPVIIKINNRKIAGSASAMPHAGNDAAPGGVWTSWRSGNYGAGPNFDWVKNNGADGHFDIHFLNSLRHKDSMIDLSHQENIKIAAGIN